MFGWLRLAVVSAALIGAACALTTGVGVLRAQTAADILKYDADHNLLSVNLDIKNPSAQQDFAHLPPAQLADDILRKEERIAALMREIKTALTEPVG